MLSGGVAMAFFTYYLLEGMRGAADKDKNGIVTVGELFDYVTESVHRGLQIISSIQLRAQMPLTAVCR